MKKLIYILPLITALLSCNSTDKKLADNSVEQNTEQRKSKPNILFISQIYIINL